MDEKLATQIDLRLEASREYDFAGRVYKIDSPQTLWINKDGHTHCVLDRFGVIHWLPAHGYKDCVIRTKNK